MRISELLRAAKNCNNKERCRMWSITGLIVIATIAALSYVAVTQPDGGGAVAFIVLFVVVALFGVSSEIGALQQQQKERDEMARYVAESDKFFALLDSNTSLSAEERRQAAAGYVRDNMPRRY